MKLTTSTTATILACTMAGAGALPAPPTTTEMAVAPAKMPDVETVPIYPPQSSAADMVGKRGPAPGGSGLVPGGIDGPYLPGLVGPSIESPGGGNPPTYRYIPGVMTDSAGHMVYAPVHRGGPIVHRGVDPGHHGPMPDHVDHADPEDTDSDDEEEHQNSRRDNQPAKRKTYKWWEYQTGKDFMGIVVGNPNIPNTTYKQAFRHWGSPRRRALDGPKADRDGNSDGPRAHSGNYKIPLPHDRYHSGPLPDGASDYY